MKKVIMALIAITTLTGSLFATSIKAQLGTTLNTENAYALWTFDKEDNDFEFAFNMDFGMTFNNFMGFNVMYAYRKGMDENEIRPAFTMTHKLGNKGWKMMMLTGPSFIMHSDKTDYGVDLLGYLMYDFSANCFIRLGTGISFIWSKDARDDWQWQGKMVLPQLGFGFTF